jgi:diguanylate cyclase (GGDEF)-like protein
VRLQAKLILVVVPLIAASLLALGWIAHAQLRETSTQTTLREMTSLLDQVSRNVEAVIETAEANVELFSHSVLLQKYMLIDDESVRYTLMQPRLMQLFAGYQEAYPDYGEIRVLLPDGYEDTRVTRAYRPNVTEEEADTPLFKALEAFDGEIYTKFFHNPDNQKTSLLVAKKLDLKDPAVTIRERSLFRGYLAVTVDLEFIAELVAQNHIGETGEIFFGDNQGNILFAHHNEISGGTLASALVTQLRHAADTKLPVTITHRGGQNLFQARRPHADLLLVARLPEAEMVAASRELGYLVAGITLVAILVTTALLFVLLRRLLIAPIQNLRHAAREIGRGNLEVDVDLDRRDEFGELATSFREMSGNLQRSSDQIRRLAYRDSLTGLANRRMFTEYLSHALAHAQRHRQILALLFLDLDDFKRVNDTLGHQVGDQVLQEIAERLSKTLRTTDYLARGESDLGTDTIARLGGDEFIVLLPDLKDPRHAAVVAGRVLRALSAPLPIANREFHISTSIGITTYPGDGDDVDTLVKNGDIAMYHAKAQGKNVYQYFDESMNVAAVERLNMENALRKAIKGDELVLYYQPLIGARTGKLVGAEALIRWQHPEMGFLAPGQFIPAAEETGLIVPMGEWVLAHACMQNKAWQDAGFEPIPVSVNISNRQFADKHLSRVVRETLAHTGLDPSYLDIELTESSIMHAEEQATKTLNEIKALGVQTSMDDFGTGYSSLGALRRLPIDTLKIDRSFVVDITTDKDDAAIISAVIAMAKVLNLRTTAEGVETKGQFEFLRALECDVIQGFLFSKPVPADELVRFFDQDLAITA